MLQFVPNLSDKFQLKKGIEFNAYLKDEQRNV